MTSMGSVHHVHPLSTARCSSALYRQLGGKRSMALLCLKSINVVCVGVCKLR